MTAKDKAVGDDCFGMRLMEDEGIRLTAFDFYKTVTTRVLSRSTGG